MTKTNRSWQMEGNSKECLRETSEGLSPGRIHRLQSTPVRNTERNKATELLGGLLENSTKRPLNP